MRSVIYARSMHGRAIHPTQKPGAILEPMIEYGCAPGGLIVDPFSGADSQMPARMLGRRAIGIELREAQAEQSALWLSQMTLESA
jgi:site-specific DNA-methyltransferase (adenine-specific)